MKQNTPIDPPPSSPDWETRMSRTEALVADLGVRQARWDAILDRREKLAEEDREWIAADRKRIADDRKRIAEEHAALDRKISDEVKRAEGFRDNLARAAEDAFAFRLKDILRDNYGLQLDEVLRRVQIVNHGRELDILGLNGSVAVVGEVKIRLQRDDVLKFVGVLGEFRDDFPDHARETVYGVVAGETVDDDAAALARKRGFFVLRMDEGVVCPETPDGFRPRAY